MSRFRPWVGIVAVVLVTLPLGGWGGLPALPNASLPPGAGCSRTVDYTLYSDKDFSDSEVQALKDKAEQGDARAQHLLSLYYRRIGDPEGFSSWRSCAASGGYPDAQYSLGHSYRHGLDGVPVDKVQAYKWYKLAIEGGFGSFQLASLAEELSAEQIAEAERLVAQWRPGPGSCDAAASPGSS